MPDACLRPGGDGRFSQGGRSGRLGFLTPVGLLAGLANVNSALEECAVFNGDAGSDHVASERAIAADIDAIAGGQIAADLAEYNDFPRIDVGGDHAIAADRDAIAGEA